MKRLLALLLVFAAAAAFAQNAYRWVDKNGKVHYSDEPPPPAETKSVESKRLQGSVEGGPAEYSYEARKAAEEFPVILFVAPDCGELCKEGRNLLRRRGIPFNEAGVETADEFAAFKAATALEKASVPTLVVGRKTQIGWDAELWNGLLDAAGYPAAGTRRTTEAPRK